MYMDSYVLNPYAYTQTQIYPVGWSCRIHQLLLYGGVRPFPECPVCDTKQSYGEVPVMLELWGIGVPLHCYCSQVHSGLEW